MSVVSTVGRPEANSFLSMAEINTRMNAFSLKWVGLPDSHKERFAVLTAGKISRIPFLGQPLYTSQLLAFPRKGDARVNPRIYSQASFGTVSLGVSEEDCVVNVTPNGCDWTSKNFPVYSEETPIVIKITLGTETVTLGVNASGDIFSSDIPEAVGKVNFTTGEFELNALPQDGAVARVKCLWASSNQMQSADIVFDQKEYEPDLFKTGSVHAAQSNGLRDYLDIVSHNIVTGVVTLGARISSTDFSNVQLFPPHHNRIKEAQTTQLLAEVGELEWDKRAGAGLGKVKIGDTEQTFSSDRIPQKLRQLAGKYRVHEAVMGILGPMTIYGKMGTLPGEWNATPVNR